MTSPASRYLAISVSFNNKYLALFTDNQLLWIGSSDLQVGTFIFFGKLNMLKLIQNFLSNTFLILMFKKIIYQERDGEEDRKPGGKTWVKEIWKEWNR